MNDTPPPIPQPTPFDEADPPEVPEHLRPTPPGPIRVIQLSRDGTDQLAIIFKRTYRFEDGRPPRPTDEQIPLDPEGATHEPLDEAELASYASLPELVGFKTGTDLVVQGSARPRRPTPEMRVGVRVGEVAHGAVVFGTRHADYVNGKLVFTPPEPFESVPLRYENAYGGRDLPFEERLAQEVQRTTPADDLRGARPSFQATFEGNHPLAYPRNRFGNGYVMEAGQELIEGRELPNLERIDDRLTPERLVVGHPLEWGKQPIPVGFDYLDPSSFPRTALLGIPQASRIPLGEMPEVARGLLPADYSRGTIFDRSPPEIPPVLHPHGSRCASLGLWLPYLRGNEVVALEGMDAARPRLRASLPGERPAFSGPVPGRAGEELVGDLLLVVVEVDARRLSLVWSARTALEGPLPPAGPKEIQEKLTVRMLET